jgi:hypothetical protein
MAGKIENCALPAIEIGLKCLSHDWKQSAPLKVSDRIWSGAFIFFSLFLFANPSNIFRVKCFSFYEN